MPDTFDNRLPLGDLPSLKQVFTEQFTEPLVLGAWKDSSYYRGKFRAYGPSDGTSWQDSSHHGRYEWENMEVRDGAHISHLRTVNGEHQVSALSPIRQDTGKSTFMHGRFSVMAKFPKLNAATGGWYKVAWLLWPDGGAYKRDGEIDFPEIDLWTDMIRGFVHYTDQDTTLPTQQATYKNQPFDFTVPHVYTIDWTPGKVEFTLDGVLVKTVTTRVPKVPMHWVMQNETALGGGKPAPSASAKGDVVTYWVAAWQYDPSIVIAPIVSVTSPLTNTTVFGVVPLAANAAGATSVKWFVDGVEVGHDGGGAPWTDTWDSRLIANGAHRLFAKALTPAGWITSPTINITVTNT